VLLEHLAYLQAKTASRGGGHTKDFDLMRAIPIVLELDAADEERVERHRAIVTPRIERVKAERASDAELLRLAIGALRDVAMVDVSSVLARIEKERSK
jgi:hypothetical protein